MTQPDDRTGRDPDVGAALRRAGTRAVYHLLRAGVEGLRALEAVAEELGKVGRPLEEEDRPRKVRIDVE